MGGTYMLNTITNVTLTQGAWTNIYTASGLAVGSKIYIQNQSSDFIKVFVGTTPTDNAGDIVEPFGYAVIAAGVSGAHARTVDGVGGVLAVSRNVESLMGAPIDERVYTGYKAFTIQNFIESNVKNSTQWEFSSQNLALAAGAFQDAVFIVGDQPVLIKSRQIVFTGAAVTAQVFETPTYTGGTTASIYNLNRITPTACLSSIKTGVTASATGTQIAAPTFAYGTDAQGNRVVGTFTVTGLERVLKPNTTYLLRITNNDTVTCKIGTYVTFYEGEISSLN